MNASWKTTAVAAATLVGAFATPLVHADNLTFVNNSGFDIERVYVSLNSDGRWGYDRLGSRVLDGDGSHFTVWVPNGQYDIRLVDEDGDQCKVMGVSIYGSRTINISTNGLLRCETNF